jgi:hypothetical protein
MKQIAGWHSGKIMIPSAGAAAVRRRQCRPNGLDSFSGQRTEYMQRVVRGMHAPHSVRVDIGMRGAVASNPRSHAKSPRIPSSGSRLGISPQSF